jgi:hypothetical protein
VTELAALQEALAGEQAAVYGYGVVGAHLAGKAQAYAAARLTAHEVRRDQLAALVTAAGAVPAAALPAYQLPFAVTDHSSAAQFGAHLENGVCGVFWDLAAASAAQADARSLAVESLSDTALAAAHWGGATAMPGQPGVS